MRREIILANSVGFCFGVKKAIEKAEEYRQAFIYGSLIHNPQEVKRLDEAGKKIINDLDELQGNQIFITAHGLDVKKLEEMKDRNLQIIDTTCPLVVKIYREGWALEEKGCHVVIIGDPEHVEVKGIASRMKAPYIVYRDEDLTRIPDGIRLGVICQSTLLQEKFTYFTDKLKKRFPNLIAINTICKPTQDRQNAAEDLAKQVEVMIVIGGRNSSNTNKLMQVCEKYLKGSSYHIETAEELTQSWFEGKKKVGITAGTSTPDYLIQQVVARIRSFDTP